MTPAPGKSIQAIYPLSPVQQGMLFHSLLERQSGVYVVQVGFTLQGRLDEGAFAKAWQSLVQRHDVLRTAFAWEKLEAPVQVVGREAHLPIETLDWECSASSEAGYRSDLENWLAADRQRGFDPRSAPLMRVALIRLGPTRSRVVWTYHHLLLDGWSLPLLLREWVLAYQQPRSLPVSGSPLRYRDYIAWLQKQDQQLAIKYWKSHLEGLALPTSLGVDQRGAADPSEDVGGQNIPAEATNADRPVATAKRLLSRELTARIKTVAQQKRLTLGTFVQAAWAAILARYSDQEDVVFGLARAGRPPTLPQFDQRVGMFINTLPMRIQVGNQENLLGWLETIQLQQQEQQAFEYAALSEIHAASEFARNVPLFESVVVVENYPAQAKSALQDDQLVLEDVTVQEQTNYPLSLFAVVQDQLEMRLLYSSHRFATCDIDQMLSYLELVLSTMIERLEDSDAVVGELFTDLDRGGTDVGEVISVDELECAHHRIARYAESQPDATAVIFQDQEIDYQTLELAVQRRVTQLRQQGVVADGTVGILLQRSMETVVSLLAVLRLAAKYVPLDPAHPKQRLGFIIDDAGLDLIIVQQATEPLVAAATNKTFCVDGEVSEPTERSELAVESEKVPLGGDLRDTAYLMYTSGSTGLPKGVPVTHDSLANLLQSMARRIGFNSDNRLLAVTTLAFDIATLELLLPLSCGACLVVADEETVRDSRKLCEAIGSNQIDVMQATPATWRMVEPCLSAGEQLTVLCGGESLDFPLAQKLLKKGVILWNVYGPTETTIWSSAIRLDESRIADGTVPIGNPLANTTFVILDSKLRPTPRGVAGELCIGGMGLSVGYHNREELTADRFVNASLSSSEQNLNGTRLYRTGDRVRQRSDGRIEFLGRMDCQVKLRGHRIELGEIELALQAVPGIEQAVVVLQNEGTAEGRLIAFFSSPQKSSEEQAGLYAASDLRAQLSMSLPAYMIPTSYQQLDAFPLTQNRKIDRKALITREVSVESEGGVPHTPLERKLADIWQDVLQVDQVGLRDNFFEMGGHSLMLLTAQSRLQEKLNIDVPLLDFFRHPTLHAFAAHITDREGDSQISDRSAVMQAGKDRQARRRKKLKR